MTAGGMTISHLLRRSPLSKALRQVARENRRKHGGQGKVDKMTFGERPNPIARSASLARAACPTPRSGSHQWRKPLHTAAVQLTAARQAPQPRPTKEAAGSAEPAWLDDLNAR